MESQRTEILNYINVIIERKYIFVFVSLCIMSFIVWGSYFVVNKYKAESTIFIERNVIENLVKDIAITPSMRARIRVLKDTMVSRSLVLSVLRKLDLDIKVESDRKLEEMINSYQKRTTVNIGRNNLIKVSFVSTDPVIARDYVNTLVSGYVEENIFAKRSEADDATKFLNEQVVFFKAKMDEGEDAIIQYRQNRGIYITIDERSIIEEINQYSREIEEIQTRLSELIAADESIKKQLDGEVPFMMMMSSQGTTAGKRMEALEKQLELLLLSYTENHPDVIKIKAEIETLNNQNITEVAEYFNNENESEMSGVNPVYQGLKQKFLEVETDINSLYAKEKHLQSKIKSKEGQLKSVPEERKKLADLEQERHAFKNVYEKLLMRLGQAEVSNQMEIHDKTTTFRIIEPAILPKIPISPNRVKLILAGIVAGLVGGYVVVFLLGHLDNSVKTIDTLKSFDLPVLAMIPEIKTSEDLYKTRMKDIMFYSCAGIYMLCILGALITELMGLPYIERIVTSIL